MSATDHCEEEEKLIECRDHQDAAHRLSHLGFHGGTVSQVQDSDVAFFLDGDDLGRVPDGALGQLVLERLQQEVPLHGTDFVWPADVTTKMTRGVRMFARQIMQRLIGVF